MDAVLKMASELKTKNAILIAELAEYKYVRSQLRTTEFEQENSNFRSKLRKYEDVIYLNNLWSYFSMNRNKNEKRF